MKKRIFSALMALCLAFSISGAAFAEPTATPAPASIATPTPTPSETPDPTPTPTAAQEGTEGDEPTAEPSATPSPEPSETPEPSEVPDSEAENTVTEDPGTSVPAGSEQQEGGTEYTATLDQDGQTLNVTVTAPAGAFDAGVEPTLKVSAIEDEAALDAIAGELDGEVEYDGFAALDISFQNDAGEEIEPKEAVSVRIELPEAIVDSGIDLTTLAVQHLAEDAEGNVTEVEQVASVEDGTITLSDAAIAAANEAAGIATMTNGALTDTAEAAVVAEFEVSGFSDFVITWQGTSQQGDGTARIEFWDATNDKPLTVSPVPEDIDLSAGSEYTNESLEQIIQSITVENYTYAATTVGYYSSNNEWSEQFGYFDSVSAEYHNRDLWDWYNYWDYTVNGSDWGFSITVFHSEPQPVIRINYIANSSSGGGEDEPGTPIVPTYRKYVDKTANGVYDLTLDVTGEIRTAQGEVPKIDILYVLDDSSSMSYSMGNSNRRSAANKAIDGLEEELKKLAYPEGVDGNPVLDIYHSLILFNDNAHVETEWRSIKSDLGLPTSSNGGTNYNGAIATAKSQIASSMTDQRKDAIKVVIFVSDGEPDPETANGYQEIHNLDLGANGRFYAIGVSNNVTYDTLNGLIGSAWHIADANKKCVVANSSTTLADEFKSFAAEMTNIDCSNVTISDTLSDLYVELTSTSPTFTISVDSGTDTPTTGDITIDTTGDPNVDGGFSGSTALHVSYTGAGGETQTEDISVTLTYYPATKTYNVSFGKDYVVHDGWTYSVTTQIQPTQAAVDKYIADGEYPDIGDENTDAPDTAEEEQTSSGKLGFYSNESATLTYTSNGQETTLGYPKPVVQVVAPTVEPLESDPDIRKYVDDNDNGTYDLSLDVTGTDAKQPLNVLYILDESYSMMWTMDGDYPDKDISSPSNSGDSCDGPNDGGDNRWPGDAEHPDGNPANEEYTYSYVRVNAAKAAIRQLNTLLEANQIDANVALATFAYDQHDPETYVGKTISWSPLDVDNFQNQLTTSEWESFASGTNYVEAFQKAETLLAEAPKNDDDSAIETVVIFITDGEPNWPRTDGQPTTQYALDQAKKEAAKLNCDRFYAIGVSGDIGSATLEAIVDAVRIQDNYKGYYANTDTAGLLASFNQIAEEIAGTVTNNVVITDELSDYAELISPSTPPTITIEDENGTSMVEFTDAPEKLSVAGTGDNAVYTGTYTFTENGESVELKYTYTASSKTFTLRFPDDYSLTKDWTYTITVQIRPTTAAEEYLAANSNVYPHTGEYDATTGVNTDVPGTSQDKWTSSGKPGFYSNDSATLDYNKVEDPKDYPKPVIQVKTGTLTITKEISGVSTTTAQTFYFTISTNNASVSGKTYTTSATGTSVAFSKTENEQELYTATISLGAKSVENDVDGAITVNGLPAGSYTVQENTSNIADIDDYYFDDESYSGTVGKVNVNTDEVTKEQVSATVTAGADTQVDVTNIYKPYLTLTVEKDVTGEMGNTDEFFSFTVTKTNAGAALTADNITNNNVPDDEETPDVDEAVVYVKNVQQGTGQSTVTLEMKDSGQIVIGQIKDSDVIQISETAAAGYNTTIDLTKVDGYTPGTDGATHAGFATTQGSAQVTVTVADVQMNEGNNSLGTIRYDNHRGVVAPTGLESNHTAPYALMVTAAGVAGLALLGSMAARRRRRQE